MPFLSIFLYPMPSLRSTWGFVLLSVFDGGMAVSRSATHHLIPHTLLPEAAFVVSLTVAAKPHREVSKPTKTP